MTQKKTTAELRAERQPRQRKPKASSADLGSIARGFPAESSPTGRAHSDYVPPFHPLPKYMGDKGIEAYGSMPIQFGRIKARIFGGPFREYVPGQRRVVSVKMAAEIDKACDISIPTKDYEVPPVNVMHSGVAKALQAILDGNDIYAGCWGGTGRTGLFMACMAKVMWDYYQQDNEPERYLMGEPLDPVAYVRRHYRPHAVETQEQEKFVADFDTSGHVFWLQRQLQPKIAASDVALSVIGTDVVVFIGADEVRRKPLPVIEKEVRVEVPVYYWNPLRALLEPWWPGLFKDKAKPGDQMPPY